MAEEILPNIYKIELPIPDSSLEVLNSYVVRGSEKDLIIDAGLDREECLKAMQSGLRELEVDLKKTDFFITHMHPDHLGLVRSLATDTTRIYFNRQEADRIRSGVSWDDYITFARLNGFPEEEIQSALRILHGFEFTSNWRLAFHILKEGDAISIGDNLFKCVETPGHSRGHMCLYEPNKKIFVSGDHILGDITPGIQLWSDEWDPLKKYLDSLDKVYKLDIEMVLPGHRNIFKDCKERIEELRNHHQIRLDEIISVLEKGTQDAFQIGSQMSWDVTCDSWDLFPILQKWLAIGEAIAHLKYLEDMDVILKEIRQQKIIYSLKY